MGMYTEIFVRATVTSDNPQVRNIIFGLFDEDATLPPNNELPQHPFFHKLRWQMIGCCSSFYHQPSATSRVFRTPSGISQDLYVCSRSDLKNYGEEIEAFFDWLAPYVEPGFIGYSLYEEDTIPTIYIADPHAPRGYTVTEPASQE